MTTFLVDKILNCLPQDESDRFRQWATFRPSSEILRSLLGYYEDTSGVTLEYEGEPLNPPSRWAVERWKAERYRPGAQALARLESVATYQGVLDHPEAFLAQVVTVMSGMVTRLDSAIASGEPGRQDAYNLYNCAKELRTAILQSSDRKERMQETEAYLNGAARLVQIATAEVKGKAYSAQVLATLEAAIARIEAEAKAR